MTGFAGILILFGLLIFSVRERTQRLQKAHRGKENVEEMPIHGSPLAESISQTVGIAGGIYIAIVTTINFLKLDVPETFTCWGISLDPIATTAFLVTILHPFILAVFDKFKVR